MFDITENNLQGKSHGLLPLTSFQLMNVSYHQIAQLSP